MESTVAEIKKNRVCCLQYFSFICSILVSKPFPFTKVHESHKSFRSAITPSTKAG